MFLIGIYLNRVYDHASNMTVDRIGFVWRECENGKIPFKKIRGSYCVIINPQRIHHKLKKMHLDNFERKNIMS